METYKWFVRDASEAGRAQCDRCLELFNKAAGSPVTYIQESHNPDRPGWGVPVGIGIDGAGDAAAEAIEAVRLALLGQGQDVAAVQGRVTPAERTEITAMLGQAQPEQDDWNAGGPL